METMADKPVKAVIWLKDHITMTAEEFSAILILVNYHSMSVRYVWDKYSKEIEH
jgi:hypothetical protein